MLYYIIWDSLNVIIEVKRLLKQGVINTRTHLKRGNGADVAIKDTCEVAEVMARQQRQQQHKQQQHKHLRNMATLLYLDDFVFG